MQFPWGKYQSEASKKRPWLALWNSFDQFISSPFSQKTSHTINLISAVSLFAGIFVVFYFVGLLAPSKPPIMPGEIDLSGPWKISLADKSEFASKNYNDSTWCYSGVPDPKLGMPNTKNPDCSADYYPVEKMRQHTYWYRTSINIPAGFSWKEPSLFLGAIKHKGWIYWDGELVGISNFKNGTGMTTVQLENAHVLPGKHTLAIRVASLDTRYPGIFHAYSRKVTLGEVDGNLGQHNAIINGRYVLPAISLFVQAAGLLLTIFLIALGKGTGSNFFWLALYFFATATFSAEKIAPTEYTNIISSMCMVITSFAVFGYSLRFHSWLGAKLHILSRSLFGLLMVAMGAYISLIYQGKLLGQVSARITLGISIVPFLAFAVSLVFALFSLLNSKKKRTFSYIEFLSIGILGALHTLNVVNEFFLAKTPNVLAHPAFGASLSVALVATMIYQYIQQERTLAFFGRFIRPGLRTLLKDEISKTTYSDGKFFRPRQIAIMKIDIVGHTETTFQMPYGMKRLFQDTWFTMIDQVVAHRVFMDKNVGDGSIYCFSEDHSDGSCGSALNAALQIRDESLAHFDQVFLQRLEELLTITGELKAPAEAFFVGYKSRTGIDFRKRRTRVRIGLVYGFVDEGLWGLSSQSHYDVQGDLVSLAARIESKARENEILMDEGFVKEAAGILTAQTISPRLETLKGMGEVKVFAIKAENSESLVA